MSSSKKEGRTAVVNRVCEFFVVATHAILYIQEVYPQRKSQKKRYGEIAACLKGKTDRGCFFFSTNA